MSFTPQYEECGVAAYGGNVRAQSIVECRLADWAENQMLAAAPSVVPGPAEVLSGESRYGGKLYFFRSRGGLPGSD